MTLTYKAPIRDMHFILNEVFDAPSLWQKMDKLSHVDSETVAMILEEMAKFTENEILALNQSGDDEGASYQGDGVVHTPKGYNQAFKSYGEAGWIGLGGDVNYEGQGMPKMVTMLTEEMLFSTNQAFALYPNLTTGASLCLLASGSEEQKAQFLPKLYSGEWSGTMCLTEPHAGTDLGIIKTRAVPNDDGSYAITGTKIFITAGEHDLSENIIHLVLAKTPNAPAGSKGISLFLVPKFLVNADGTLGERNHVKAGSIEHKMGIKASATCVMNFDNAKGYMVGAENTGLASMFVMMNYERVTMGLQGLGAMELAYQNALAYANERLQGRADDGVKSSDKPADAIIHHGDVRRMLLTARANAEAARCFSMYAARELDIAKFSDDETAKKQAAGKVALLTPIAKAFLTDRGFESAVECQQVFGGHGYIKEWGMEQIVRDTRISQIYEGTNGIQALDLLGRKVIKDNGVVLQAFFDEMTQVADSLDNAKLKTAITHGVATLKDLTKTIGDNLKVNPNTINGVAVDYLQALGYVCFAYMFALITKASVGKDDDFYQNKSTLADFYVSRIFPRFDAHVAMIKAGVDEIMAYQF